MSKPSGCRRWRRLRPERSRRAGFLAPRASLLASLLIGFLTTGCANPGPPRPPSLHLPALVTDLSAERTGGRVLLRWTTPSVTTDDLAIKGPMTAQICREVGPRPGTPVARLAACAPVLRLAVAPGPSEVADTLPAALVYDPVLLLTYRVQILNSVERSAGDSALAAYAASGKAPPAIDSLDVAASEHGAVLEWALAANTEADEVQLTRTDISAPKIAARPPKTAQPRPAGRGRAAAPAKSAQQSPVVVHLRTTELPHQASAGTVDATANFGDSYAYIAARVRPVTIGTHRLEIFSESSAAATVVMRDTFPPGVPSGLATVPGTGTAPPYIDLSWEPDTEADLAGYFVYRQLVRPDGEPEGNFARLTALPVIAPAYRDVAVSPGQRYSYQVTAVDASGNESAPSAKALEAVTAEQK